MGYWSRKGLNDVNVRGGPVREGWEYWPGRRRGMPEHYGIWYPFNGWPLKITYGMMDGWPSRSEWIVPGTGEEP